MNKIKKNEFICDVCKKIYIKAWSDKEALREAKAIWQDEIIDTQVATICDDCFQRGYKNIYNGLSK